MAKLLGQRASTERDDAATRVEDREDDPLPEHVAGPAAVVVEREPGLDEDAGRNGERSHEIVRGDTGEAESKLTDDFAVVAPRAQVLPSRAGARMCEQAFVVELRSLSERVVELVAAVAVLGILGIGVVADRDPRTRPQSLDGLDEVTSLDATDEADDVPRRLAAEAVIKAFLAVDRERR